MDLRPALILLACAAAVALAQAPAPAPPPAGLPPAMALPWRLVGIDPARSATARAALTASEQALAAAVIDSPRTLTELATARRPVPLNTRRIADRIRTGTLKAGPSGLVPLAIEPTWSSLFDHELLTVTVADATRNVLLGAAHVAVPRAQWPAGGLDGFLGGQLAGLARRALDKAAAHPLARPGARPPDALHVGFSLGRAATRQDEGSSHAFTLLLEEALAPRYTVARALGGDRLATARDLLELPPTLRRPTRGIVLRWFHDPEVEPIKPVEPPPSKSRGRPAAAAFGQKIARPRAADGRRSLPAKMRLVTTLAETVHGEHLADAQESAWEFSRAADGTVAFTLAPALEALLARQSQSLLASDMPQAVAIDRAWVYVDRGRAWGLKIGDRLVARVGDKPGDVVKGHVVQYFGPELRLTSGRGFPIEEGAVVYVRKNQAGARKGMVFQYDPATYPAPWPPRAP